MYKSTTLLCKYHRSQFLKHLFQIVVDLNGIACRFLVYQTKSAMMSLEYENRSTAKSSVKEVNFTRL
jgi:hypothetical protein